VSDREKVCCGSVQYCEQTKSGWDGRNNLKKEAAMKRMFLVGLVVLAFNSVGWAQMGGGMMGEGMAAEPETQAESPQWGPGMMGYGYGMGPGMMGYGYGMGPGMMGYGMGPGMMGYGMGPGMMGYGMGPGMMGGCDMGPGMMGYGMGPGRMGYYNNPRMQKFLDETHDLRKELHSKRFEYMEAVRNPKTSPEDMEKLRKEIFDLSTDLYKKMPTYPYDE